MVLRAASAFDFIDEDPSQFVPYGQVSRQPVIDTCQCRQFQLQRAFAQQRCNEPGYAAFVKRVAPRRRIAVNTVRVHAEQTRKYLAEMRLHVQPCGRGGGIGQLSVVQFGRHYVCHAPSCKPG